MLMRKKTKIECVEATVELLAGYHAVLPSDPDFRVKYRHLLTMLQTMKGL